MADAGSGVFAHIVAGSPEAYLLVLNGDPAVTAALSGFALPALFAMMAYAQVRNEIASAV